MGIRKEQALFLIAAAFGLWMYKGLEPVKKYRAPRATAKEWKVPTGVKPITVNTPGPKNLRELFVEPSESRPLPPRADLPFLPLADLPVVLIPLEVGQQPAAYWGLRHSALTPQGGGGGGTPAAAAPGGVDDAPAVVVQDSPETRYDRLIMLDGLNKFWGLFLGEDEEKYRLASNKGPFPGTTFKFQWIDAKTGKTVRVRPIKGAEVSALQLAKTLRNEVGMRLHRFKASSTNIEAQRDFIQYLLEKARIDPEVYRHAMDRANEYGRFASPDEEGILMKARVLRAMGDLAGEYKLFRDLDEHETLKGSSFQMRGLGIVESKLGLDKLAEEHLRQAVKISKPIDPRNYAAFATFLLDRGRAREAVGPARNAVRFKTRRDPTPAELVGFHEVYVRALLATGDVTEADAQTIRSVPPAMQARADYQAACVAYATKDFATAEPLFQKVYNTGRLPDALLGIGACQLGKGDLEAGKTSLAKVVDEQPRLRHLGLAGLGLALSATQGNDALEKIDAAIVTFPNHPYLLYLQGRQRRLNGDLDGAVEPLKKALQLHDDFLEALAELTMTYYGLFKRNNDARALISAINYVDRLAELDQKQGGKDNLFLEMQGRIHYEARDLRGAKKAFAIGEDRSQICNIGLAMVEYAQKRQDLAEFRLNKMKRDLPPDDPYRKHADHLFNLMVRHGNKEQVVDKFDRRELGKAWTGDTGSGKKRLVDGELRMSDKFNRSGLVVARRSMTGPGRFLELRVEMKVGVNSGANFAGVALEIPSRNQGSSRFRVRVGMDDRGQVVLELRDGRKVREPIRPGIDVTRDEWHTIVVSVDDADDADPKSTARFLKVFFDGRPLHDPAKPIKLNSLRRTDTARTPFDTELRAEGSERFPVDVAFRNYRRIQEKAK